LAGLLSADVDILALARRKLAERFGPVAFESDTWPFTQTDYYEPELGPAILRRFFFFNDTISVERLAEIKRLSNAIEERISRDCLRPPGVRAVNIDPGYITLYKLVLATTKDHAHRIYIQQGIYAEVTLRFAAGRWEPWPWTYPDFAADTYHTAFVRARDLLKSKLDTG